MLDRTREEIRSITSRNPETSIPVVDPVGATNNALLQSIYAETLRLHVMSLITRSVKPDFKLNRWLFPKDQTILVSNHVEHMSRQWDSPDGSHPHDEFWADRFLVPAEEQRQDDDGSMKNEAQDGSARFSLDGKQGSWLPFGLGEHMCPGRHFAKQEVIINFAVLASTF